MSDTFNVLIDTNGNNDIEYIIKDAIISMHDSVSCDYISYYFHKFNLLCIECKRRELDIIEDICKKYNLKYDYVW